MAVAGLAYGAYWVLAAPRFEVAGTVIDTAERMQTYAEGFHPSFIGLSGDQVVIDDLADSFFVGSYRQDDGLVAHNSHVTIVDREGRMRLVYGQDSIPSLARDLPRLLASRRW